MGLVGNYNTDCNSNEQLQYFMLVCVDNPINHFCHYLLPLCFLISVKKYYVYLHAYTVRIML